MRNTARVVVIGGGVVGCSVLYHLTERGWRDVVLLERSELTSGSTWHAAGGMHTVNADPNVAKLQKYTIELYRRIAEQSGQDIGLHVTGGVLLAATPDRFAWLKSMHAKGRILGLGTEIISPAEAHTLFPLLDPDCFVGALYNPLDGHLDPAGVTHAYAKAARLNGAEVIRHTKAESITRAPDGGWLVSTAAGTIACEHVVNAGGLWAREVGRMVGLELPVLAMEHMYIITEDMAEVAEINRATGKEVLHAVDFDGELYLRQERGGMLMGTYEKAGKPWSPRQTPWDFGPELLAPDLDRIAPSLEAGFRHFPAFQDVGIRKIVNGPFTFAPDGNPLVGPVRGLPNFWCACGVMAGFSQGGGVGLALANWMVDGDPGADIWGMDVARFGSWATMAHTNAKVRENYGRRWSIRYPNEELPAARPARTTPVYDRMLAAGAQMGVSYGLEVPLWFAPAGVTETFSWSRSTDFAVVGAECRAVREAVGLTETSSFAKYEIAGPAAAAWLDRMLPITLPAPGRIKLAPLLNPGGKLLGDFTLANLGDGRFFLVGSGPAEQHHMRWFTAHLPANGGVTVRPLGLGLVGLSIAGPRARDLLAAVTGADVSAAAFRFMDIRPLDIGLVPALVGRISFTGDLGYEIWVETDYQRTLFDTLTEAGRGFGLRLFGSRALTSLRLEKGYGTWAREYRPVYGPLEAGLGRLLALDKAAPFIGQEAARRERQTGGALRLCSFVMDAGQADPLGDEPIWFEGEVKGWVTSGGYAHGAGCSVAMGYVPKANAVSLEGWEIEILGERRRARLQPAPLFDPDGSRMRG